MRCAISPRLKKVKVPRLNEVFKVFHTTNEVEDTMGPNSIKIRIHSTVRSYWKPVVVLLLITFRLVHGLQLLPGLYKLCI